MDACAFMIWTYVHDTYVCAMAYMWRSEHSFTELVLSFALSWILRMNIGPRVYIWSSASNLSADPSH